MRPIRLLNSIRHLSRAPEVLRCQRHTSDWLRLTAAYIGVQQTLPFSITLSTGDFEFREPSDIATFWQIFYREVYPVDSGDRVIIDAGANIGAFSLYALSKAANARVIAVEPAPDTSQRMRHVLHEHGLESLVTLNEAALGAEAGETSIQLTVGSQFRQTGIGGHCVPIVTLESLTREEQEIDLLKIDIEGAEYGVIASTPQHVLRRIRKIFMEVHPNAPAETAIRPLQKCGFIVQHFQNDGAGYGIVRMVQAG